MRSGIASSPRARSRLRSARAGRAARRGARRRRWSGASNAPDGAAFLVRAVAHFAGLGIRVRAVMTDNYWSYTKSPRYRAALQSLGLRHLVIPRYTPRINGKVEAFIGVLLREWAYARPYVDNRARSIALHHFVAHYTHRRPHGGLGGLTPMQRLTHDVHNVRGQYS